jgi:hypothetical protein
MKQVRDPAMLGRQAVVWAYAWLAAKALAGLAALGVAIGIRQAGDARVGIDPVAPILVRWLDAQWALAIVALLLFVVASVIGLLWVYRITSANRTLVEGTIAPGWAVGWFLIPVANLLMPFRAIREAWQASSAPAAWHGAQVPALLRWWWAAWLAFGLLGNLPEHVPAYLPGNRGLALASGLHFVVALLSVPLTLMWVRIVRHISAAQLRMLRVSAFV